MVYTCIHPLCGQIWYLLARFLGVIFFQQRPQSEQNYDPGRLTCSPERFCEIITSRQIWDKLEVNAHALGFIAFLQFFSETTELR